MHAWVGGGGHALGRGGGVKYVTEQRDGDHLGRGGGGVTYFTYFRVGIARCRGVSESD